MAEELCDTCGVGSKDGTACMLMFQEKTEITTCTRYAKDEKKHAKLASDAGVKPKEKPAEAKKEGGEK